MKVSGSAATIIKSNYARVSLVSATSGTENELDINQALFVKRNRERAITSTENI